MVGIHHTQHIKNSPHMENTKTAGNGRIMLTCDISKRYKRSSGEARSLMEMATVKKDKNLDSVT